MTLVIAHHDDFDGCAAAAVLTAQLRSLQQSYRSAGESVRYVAVDHTPDTDKAWRNPAVLPFQVDPGDTTAIVDFPYHPMVDYWFDHHATSFKTPEYLEHFHGRVRNGFPGLHHSLLDPSCARTVYRYFHSFNLVGMLAMRPLVDAADMIDGARYPSPQAVYDMELPALKINAVYRQLSYGQRAELVSRMAADPSLDSAVKLVEPMLPGIVDSNRRTIEAYAPLVEYANGVVALDIADTTLPFLRYAPYLYYPASEYAVTLYRYPGAYGISMAQNPWNRPSNPVHLGALAKHWDGGGHEYAAGVSTTDLGIARNIHARVVQRLREAQEPQAA